jgi:alkyl sulfatase BDS1-like metallo-beta-lactamase superfamily hydrolase
MLLLGACGKAPPAPPPAVASPAALEAHTAEFRQELIDVAPGVRVAVGWGIANVIFLEGPDGVVVVDTMETLDAAAGVLAAYRKVSDLPIRALVYTHSHPDHIGGAGVFAADAGAPIPVYAHADLTRQMQQTSLELQAAITRRSQRMYGSALPEDQRSNIGIGGFLAIGADSSIHTVMPTEVFDEQLDIEAAGLRLQLRYAPGETGDQIFVWLPETRVLLPGDNFYRAFPNLYTLRGTSYRDPRAWADAIDAMRALQPAVLVPSHTRPLVGEAAIEDALRDYRDAIRYVYDQTLRGINQGLGPEAIAAQLRLPAHLAASPWLAEFYGTPAWSARSIYSGLLGWFDGNPRHIRPLPPQDSAARWVDLAGGIDALGAAAEAAVQEGDFAWVLELTDAGLQVAPEHSGLREARIAALRGLAAVESNPNARHWFLTTAAELAGEVQLADRILTPTPEMLAGIPLARYFDALAVNLDAAAAADQVLSVAFDFGDEAFTYHLRRGASEVRAGIDPEAELQVRMDAQVFKEMLAELRSPAVTLVRDAEMVRGGRLAFLRFMRLFVPVEAESP